MQAILHRHWPDWEGQVLKREGGWNNTTYFVEQGGRRAVLRIYDTHKDRTKIEFEHAVLQALAPLQLPFNVPVVIRTVAGDTVAQLQDGSGKYACLFVYMEGDSPAAQAVDYMYSFGDAAGILSSALAEVQIGRTPVYRPYYALAQAYPLCTREVIEQLCLTPPEPLKEVQAELQILYEAYLEIADSLQGLEQLPHQLVHGDLNASNLLLQQNDVSQVAALLDFEFCTFDVRAMEPAVILSALLEQPAAVRDFCRGFTRHISLSADEINALPLLMKLRKVDVFLHFVSRFLEGTDGPKVLLEQAVQLSAELNRLTEDCGWVQEELRRAKFRVQ
ncbi:phosphotransferase [Paenibacillus donghaensis]|uniref:Aminoglycoside phosphotransferase n=1 Tax=Paenibacillus donghaensis TaxID=414771 RepID=A0A2Z2KDM8_9BACL|nr:phosphotransferase [Paenibacillus donghaensis]ASA21180.1 aminoglycoside phosphotransferase [Paenibacillus donghaensis]